MDFFVSYSEHDRELEALVSRALTPHGTVSGRATVESGGLRLVEQWIAERGGQPAAVICLISRSYLAGGSEIANVVSQPGGPIWLNVYLDESVRSSAVGARPGVPIDGLDLETAALHLTLYFETVFTDPDLFAPKPDSGSLGMRSRHAEPLTLGELRERREQADANSAALTSALESPSFSAAPPPPSVPAPRAQAPAPQPPPPERVAGNRRGWIDWLLIGGAVALAAFALKDWLGHLLAGAGVLSQGVVQPVPPQAGRVDVSAFAPEGGAPGERVLVQVLLHVQSDLQRAGREARRADRDAGRRMTVTLTQDIAPGQLVTVIIEGDDLVVDESVQHIIWRGEPVAVQSTVMLPSRLGYAYVRCRLFVDTVPVGSLRFGLRVTEAVTAPKVEMRGDSARRYSRAFLSYSSDDRVEVLKRAQGLRAAGIDFFQDILSLEPGEKWVQRLNDEIDRCDLFLLFWSSNSAKSEWVTRETERAVARQRATDGSPEITPVIIEVPTAKPIPESLRDLHFNDYVMLGAMSEPRDRPQT